MKCTMLRCGGSTCVYAVVYRCMLVYIGACCHVLLYIGVLCVGVCRDAYGHVILTYVVMRCVVFVWCRVMVCGGILYGSISWRSMIWYTDV